jgi:hypothetical protein
LEGAISRFFEPDLVDAHQSFGLGERQRPQPHRVGDAQHRGGGAEAEPEAADDGGGEGRAADQTGGEDNVVADRFPATETFVVRIRAPAMSSAVVERSRLSSQDLFPMTDGRRPRRPRRSVRRPS